jgi:hypothetical protein
MPIRVTMEIIPRGDETRKFVAGVLDIANDGTGSIDSPKTGIGHYDFRITGPTLPYGEVDFWAKGRLEGFERNRGWWSCVKECLNKVDTDYEKEGA